MRKKKIIFFSLIFIIHIIALGGEQKSKRIFLNTTISGANIQTNVYDFPALIRLNGQTFNFNESDGSDIRFVSSENVTLCHFIERFDSTDKVAEIFVKIPEIVANNNTQFIKMLYGDPEAPGGECPSEEVFSNEYAGIWLMDTAPIHGCYNAIKDRSVNGNHGTAYYMSSSKLVDGKIGNAIRFDGYNDFIWLEMAPSLNELQKNYTVSCWMKTETLYNYHKMFSASKYYNDGFGFGIKNNKLYFAAYNRQGYVFYDYSLQCNKWYHVAATMDQYNNVHFYVDGVEKGVVYGCYTPLRNTSTFFLGATTQTYTSYVEQLWKGTLDQICISSTTRSADWLKLQYENQRTNQQLIEIETEEDEGFKVIPNLSYYTLYASEFLQLQNSSRVYGIIGTNNGINIDIQFSSYVKGDVYGGQDVLLEDDVVIEGDVTAEEDIYAQWSSVITGSLRDYSPTPQFDIPTKDTTVTGEGYWIGPGETLRINPGQFSILEAHDNSTVIFGAGTYDCLELNFIGNSINFVLDIGPHDSIEIYVRDNITFGFGFQMSFANVENPLAVKIYTNQSPDNITFTDGSEYYGIFIAPKTNIIIGSGTKVYGSIYADGIDVGIGAEICKPPFLSDLAHSEWAYAPPFNPNITKYLAVVPPNIDSLLITPTSYNPNISVTVNGGSPDIPVNIVNDIEYISIELEDGDCGLGAVYSLEVRKSPDYMIYVDANAECEDCRGDSWESAIIFLEVALRKANREGKEIWVAEGTYESPNCYEAGFLVIQPGTEVIGGFDGTETERKPKGSVYATILTADHDNDDYLSSWPPSEDDLLNYLEDNFPYVVSFITGGKGAISSKLEGFTIQGGVAIDKIMGPDDQPGYWDAYSLPKNYLQAGIYYDSNYRKYDPLYKIGSGGGIYISHSSPTIKKCYITRNYTLFDGAGMYSRAGPKLLQNCLFEDNFTYQGWGGGMYALFNKQGTIDGCVFDGNQVGDFELYSGAIYTELSNLYIVNSLFTRNIAGAAGGAIYNRQGNLTITNCTFTGNQSTYGAGGITNYHEASTNILNTILWNNLGESELQGDGFTVNYSCITGGFPDGEGNIPDNPQFLFAGNAKGGDEEYGTEDDGLRLNSTSPCINTGKDIAAVEYDIVYAPRNVTDMGAYEYYPSSSVQWGRIRNGVFYSTPPIDILTGITDADDIRVYSASSFFRVQRAEHAPNKHLSDKFYVYLQAVNSSGDYIEGSRSIKVWFYRVEQTSSKYVYQTLRITPLGSDNDGRVILLCDNISLQGTHDKAYVLYSNDTNCEIEIKLPLSQFN